MFGIICLICLVLLFFIIYYLNFVRGIDNEATCIATVILVVILSISFILLCVTCAQHKAWHKVCKC